MTSLGPATLMTLSPLVPPQIRAEADRQLKALVEAWQADIDERDALLRTRTGWHVDDPPPCSGMYLVTVWYYGGMRLVQTANYRGNGEWYTDAAPISIALIHVLAWRPLIEPYAGGKA